MNTKTLLIVSVSLVTGIVIGFLSANFDAVTTGATTENLTVDEESSPSTAMAAKRRGVRPIGGLQNKVTDDSPEIWVAIDNPEGADVPNKPTNGADAQLVRLDRQVLDAARVGDLIALRSPASALPVQVRVATIKLLSSGNVSLSGQVEGAGVKGMAMFTLADNATFATLNFSDGSYSVRGNRELAWIVPRASLKAHLDPSKPDYVVRRDPAGTKPRSYDLPNGKASVEVDRRQL